MGCNTLVAIHRNVLRIGSPAQIATPLVKLMAGIRDSGQLNDLVVNVICLIRTFAYNTRTQRTHVNRQRVGRSPHRKLRGARGLVVAIINFRYSVIGINTYPDIVIVRGNCRGYNDIGLIKIFVPPAAKGGDI